LVRQTCEAFEIQILSGVVNDHVHIFASAPPVMVSSEIIRRIKGRSASKLFAEYPASRNGTGGGIFGQVVFFATSGQVTDDRIKNYLKHHLEPNRKYHFNTEF
jgi:putative transposase